MAGKRNIEQTMKRLASAVLITFGAFGLHAADQTTIQTTTAAPATNQPQADSPLVRAAKAAQSKSALKTKKKIVITNDNLTKTGGHITTSSAPAALPPLPKADPNAAEMEHQKQVAAQRATADKAKKDAEAKKKHEQADHVKAVLEGDDESLGLGDPALIEGTAEQVLPPAPTTTQPPRMQPQKPPAP
jgi:hypothetical protein